MIKTKQRRAVLVTGSSSGIGYHTSMYLAENGFTVLATVRKESDATRLREMGNPNLIPFFPLDLTKPNQIESTSEKIKGFLHSQDFNGLYGIVNIAGGGSIAPIELLDTHAFHSELKTRILGPVILLQHLLPLIREAKGRILWIATPALIPSPFLTDIHACDFAVNFIARTLKLELSQSGISSILIRCGGIDTTSPQKTMNKLKESMSKWPYEKLRYYKPTLENLKKEFTEFDKKRTDPMRVARVIHRALTETKPHSRHRVGYMSGFAAFLELFPQPVVDWLLTRRYRNAGEAGK